MTSPEASSAPQHSIRQLDQPGDLAWVLLAHKVFSDSFEDGRTYERLVAHAIEGYADGEEREREGAWIAELDGRRVGSIFCMAGEDGEAALLRLLIVTPDARRRGVGRALVDTGIDFARRRNASRVEVWSARDFTAAAGFLQSAGFSLLSQELDPRFERDVVGQRWARPLEAFSTR
ncbi:GNAT family N-acetyltransferase [Pseudoclavibacter sp. VKM Ac-2867]|uniref:GNAT family N-acetyltransferase n=1 Tax=Pseudoclavibacter sp. VKM Ac-2867 TaxID=2783829 RepID=UPI00188DBD26|nr:GNAT family N-acetyltransferase [Pseudoclavibacter sp. VKM Ac-2867]MBF4459195.1 GNAT family N-acetyltransferase [Pseudoclavibacter sp. VKM Ac-2867]